MTNKIADLKAEKEQLAANFAVCKAKFTANMKRINRAIAMYEEAEKLANGEEAVRPKRRWQGIPDAIEDIFREMGALHVQDITAELLRRGYRTTQQSVSGLVQRYAQLNQRFKKVDRATYGLLGGAETNGHHRSGSATTATANQIVRRKGA